MSSKNYKFIAEMGSKVYNYVSRVRCFVFMQFSYCNSKNVDLYDKARKNIVF